MLGVLEHLVKVILAVLDLIKQTITLAEAVVEQVQSVEMAEAQPVAVTVA
jgi:hypothetical protein